MPATTTELTQELVAEMPVGILWDSRVPGLCARRRSPGIPPRYAFKYRVHGRQRWFSLGHHDDPESARDEATAIRIDLKRGVDHALVRDRDRALPTFAKFWETYLTDHVDGHLKPPTAAAIRQRGKLHLLPFFGQMRIDQVSPGDVKRFHAALKSKPVGANRCRSILTSVFNCAEEWNVVKWAKTEWGHNPTKHVRKYAEHPRRISLASRADLAALGVALRKLETEGIVCVEKRGSKAKPKPGGEPRVRRVYPNPFAANVFRFAVLTGARPGLVKRLRHEHVSLEDRCVRVPDGKTGFTVIPLSAAALELYARLPKIAGVPWVFPGGRQLGPLTDIWDAWRRVRTEAGFGADVTPHTLRHTFASVAVGGKETLYTVQLLLGHANPQTTQRYAHLAMDPLQEATSRVSATINAAMGPEAPPDNVVALRR